MLVRRVLGRQSCRHTSPLSIPLTRQFSELQEMKARIHAIGQTSKICSAMQSIAAAKVTACEKAASQFRDYSARLEPFWKTETDHDADVKKVLVVPVSSNRGLCGGINTSVKRKLLTILPKLEEKNIDYDFFFIGDRSRRAFQASHGTGTDAFIGQIGQLDNLQMATFDTSLEIVDKFFSDDLKFDKMIIVYNFYVSKVKYQTFVKEIYSKDITFADTKHIDHYEIDMMGTEDEFHRDNLYRLALASNIHEAIAENLASEQSSRMMAMDNATKNCDEMVAEMTLQYNGLRQSEVTSELLEVISGMEAVLGKDN